MTALGAVVAVSCVGRVEPAPAGSLPVSTDPPPSGDPGTGGVGGEPAAGGADGQNTGGMVGGGGGTGGAVPVNPPPLPPLPPGAACRVGVPLRRLTEAQFRNAVKDMFDNQATLPPDFMLGTDGLPESGFTTDPNNNAVDL
jgi:hypothetical protein